MLIRYYQRLYLNCHFIVDLAPLLAIYASKTLSKPNTSPYLIDNTYYNTFKLILQYEKFSNYKLFKMIYRVIFKRIVFIYF